MKFKPDPWTPANVTPILLGARDDASWMHHLPNKFVVKARQVIIEVRYTSAQCQFTWPARTTGKLRPI